MNGDPALAASPGDGAADSSEYVAGTLLNDSNSVFAAEVQTVGADPQLSWPGTTGRTYAVFYATNVAAGSFQPMDGYTNLTCSTPGTMSLTIPDLAIGDHYFGIQVRK